MDHSNRKNKARGEIRLVIESSKNNKSHLKEAYQQQPCRILAPYDHNINQPAFTIVNVGGGVLGGDVFNTHIEVTKKSTAFCSNQSAEKIYCSSINKSNISTTLITQEGARLEWMPHETILYNGAKLSRKTHIDATQGSKTLAGEILVFGRASQHESFNQCYVHDEWKIVYNKTVIWREHFHIDPEHTFTILNHPAGFNQAKALATILLVFDGAERYKEKVKKLLEHFQAPTHVIDFQHILIIKMLSFDTLSLRENYKNLWAKIRSLKPFGLAEAVPRGWQF